MCGGNAQAKKGFRVKSAFGRCAAANPPLRKRADEAASVTGPTRILTAPRALARAARMIMMTPQPERLKPRRRKRTIFSLAGFRGAARSDPRDLALSSVRADEIAHRPACRSAGSPQPSRENAARQPRQGSSSMGPKDPSFRYWIEYLGFRLMGLIFGAMPVELASNLAGSLMTKLGPRSKKRHPRLLRNLRNALPDLNEAERDKLADAVWRNLGRVVGEFFHIDSIVSDRVEVANPELLQAIVKSGKGAVLCGAHQANWEGASAVVNKFGISPMVVYRPVSNPYVDADLLRRRGKYYAGGMMAKHDLETPVALVRHARAGGVVGVLVDQPAFQGLPTPFFGRPAQTTPFPAMLARQCNIPLLLIHGYRMKGVRFRMFITPIEVPRTDDRNADIYAATAAMQAELEKSIREHPDQWMWTHDRWRIYDR
jgi:KDO2-lipid IV(A) lauroyltransferase